MKENLGSYNQFCGAATEITYNHMPIKEISFHVTKKLYTYWKHER